VVQGLTGQGEAIYRAGVRDAGTGPEPSKDGASLVDIRTSLDVDAMRERAGAPFGFGELDSPKDVLEALSNCGKSCAFHLIYARPFAASNLVPDSVWQSGGAEEPLLGVQRQALPGDRVLELTVDRPAKLLGQLGLDVSSETLPTLRLFGEKHGRTLLWSLGIGGPPPPMPVEGLEGPDPRPRARPAGSRRAVECLERLGSAVEDALKTVSSLEGKMRAAYLQSRATDLQSELSCALSSEVTRTEARGYERVLMDVGLALFAAREGSSKASPGPY
jgi:hypothetical protein